jgi:predicted PurR-regulated permease PerM
VSEDQREAKVRRRFVPQAILAAAIIITLVLFRHVLVPFFLAILIVYLIEPLVRRLARLQLSKNRVLPRWLAVIVVYVSFFGVLSLGSLLVVPPLAGEFASLAEEAPRFLEEVRTEHLPALNQDLQTFLKRIFPTRISENHIRLARQQVHAAFRRADATQALLGLIPPEERAFYELQIDEGEPEDEGPLEAFRIRADPVSGDYVVTLQNVELVPHPDQEGSYILRTQDERNTTFAPAIDLERNLTESLGGVVEMSGEGLAALVGLGQGLILGLLSAFVGFVLTFMIAAFISIDLPGILAYFRSMVPKASLAAYDELLGRLDRGLAGVVRGQLMICLVNGVLTSIGLLLFNVKFALILGLVAAVLSLIPIFGTIISTIPAVGMALTNGVSVALLVLLWILGIHFIEANILNPKILGSAAKIHPVLVIFALLAGEHAYGLLGALLAVPVASVLLTLLRFALARSAEVAGPTEEAAT